jgi:ketosteroid isomerase-like protein
MSLSADDIAAIRAAEAQLADALNDPEPTAWVDSYTDDAIFLGHDRPALEGRDALLAYARQMSPISTLQIEPKSTDGSGDIATVVADVTWEQDGNMIRVRSLLVWRREHDGRWRVAREMLNRGAPE